MLTGALRYSGTDMQAGWARNLDMYLWLQQQVDSQIGRVLDELASTSGHRPQYVVVFTSDHGEYGGSHGLRGKGAAAYDEAIRVPLFIATRRPPHPKAGDTRRSSPRASTSCAATDHRGGRKRLALRRRYDYLAVARISPHRG